MEKMIVAVFDTEKKAYDGSKALNELDDEGSITVHSEAVIAKASDGTVSVKKEDDSFPIRTVAGTAVGSLIGLLGGPIGVALGAGAGTLAGAISEAYVADVDTDFLYDASSKLTNGKYAVVADVSEEWETPIDTRMEALGGTVIRTVKKNYEADQRAQDIAMAKMQRDQLKTEMTTASSSRKAKLQAKIDALNKKIDTKMTNAKQRLEQMKHERDAKIQALETKRKTVQTERKTQMDERSDEIKRNYDEAEKRFKTQTADRLDRTAKGLEDRASKLRKEAEIPA
jgi:uncharacterized membrane protein